MDKTIEEQIINAGIEFTMSTCPVCIGGSIVDDVVKEFNRNKAFEEGAKWAYKYLIKNN